MYRFGFEWQSCGKHGFQVLRSHRVFLVLVLEKPTAKALPLF
jgi:hypothetical protein